MGMMDRILGPMSPSRAADRHSRAKATPVGKAGKSEEDLRRIRQGYLHSLGIRRTKAAETAALMSPPKVDIEAAQMMAALISKRKPDLEAAEAESTTADEDSSAASEQGESVIASTECSTSGSCVSVDCKNFGPLNSSSPDAFRVNFLRKLSYSKVWVPAAQRPPKSQTVIIFDWDDTLLCTSFLSLFQNRPLPAHAESTMAEVGRAARRLLELSQRLGQTFIITNAMCGWVEYSAARWAPDMLPALEKVHTISARSKYESHFPDVHQWKIQAFLEVRRKLDSQVVTNLLSVGDSDFEMEAVHVMGSEFAEALVKTVKFRENPVPEDLLKELLLVTSKFERIVEAGRHLKVCLDRRNPVNTHEG